MGQKTVRAKFFVVLIFWFANENSIYGSMSLSQEKFLPVKENKQTVKIAIHMLWLSNDEVDSEHLPESEGIACLLAVVEEKRYHPQ